MDIREALVAYLLGDATIVALVANRLSPGFAPQASARPYLTYAQIDRPTTDHLKGQDLPHPRFQLGCWGGTSLASAVALATAVRERINAGSRKDWGELSVQHSRVIDERDNFDAPVDAGEVPDFSVQLDLVIWSDNE